MVVEVELYLEPYTELLRTTYFWRRIVKAPNATKLSAQFLKDAMQ
jgi:hypothetical protein